MIGRLVEEQKVRALPGEVGEDDATTLAVAELTNGADLVGSLK